MPYINWPSCLRSQGKNCHLCSDACPVPGAVCFDDQEKSLNRNVGAIIVAVGSKLYDCRNLGNLGYGQVPDVYTSLEFERLAAANGPTAGEIKTSAGHGPESIAIVHCVGSLDPAHQPHCSGICCEYAFKFNRVIEHKLPGTRIYHLYKELVVTGKSDFPMLDHARNNHEACFIRFGDISEIKVSSTSGKQTIEYRKANGKLGKLTTDMVVLCPAIVGNEGSEKLASILDLSRNRAGFFDEMNGRLHAAQSTVKGVYLAGACQAPTDIRGASSQAMAAAGYVLSGLADGKKLTIEPIVAKVDADRCSGCRLCGDVCPYKAISFDADEQVSLVNELICHGCGTCVAACPAGAIQGNHFTNDQISAEIEAILQ